ncbi:MAG TPA: hypothetical protein VFV87_18570 [Pirellulaceae bacterium]|nr:hypothetical protein [Pirellulaceae bacterium]
MRWYFADPANPLEAAHKQRTTAAMDRWWQAFQAKAKDLSALFSRKSEWDIVSWMQDYLGSVDPRLCWEYGPAIRQEGHRLVITPESKFWLRPMVRTLLERAPQVPGWEIYPYRLPEDASQTIRAVQGRVGVNITGALVQAQMTDRRKIELLWGFPSLPGADRDLLMNAAFVASEVLMGEQVLDTWIGVIDLLDGQNVGQTRPLPMERAQATVGALIRSAHEQLPATRAIDISFEEGWYNVQLEPEPAEDYLRRDDLLVASTHAIEVFQAAHSSGIFVSSCHSRMGEYFCYLKLDADEVPSEHRVEFRSQFEDALNPQLLQAGVGGCIGGGSGLRYSYIDLALTDVNRAVPIIRQVLAHHQAPLRSWLLFFDDELAREWVGVYQHTPEPPLPAEEE